MKRIAVLGGGISGLTAAWSLSPSFDITLFEKSERVGGHIQTIEKDGFRFERGPRGFRPKGKGKATLNLIRKLDLEGELIESNATERYIYLNGHLEKVGFFFLLRLGFFNSCLKERKIKSISFDESIGEFFERRFGKKVTETLIDPLVTGIFGGSLWDISMQAAWPQILDLETTYGSVVKGYLKSKKEKGPPLLSFKKGMHTLPQRLYERLKDKIEFRLQEEVKKIEWKGKKIFINGLEFDFCVCALPSWALEPLLSVEPISYLTMTTINLGWHKKVLSKQGFGYLIPSKEKEPLLGVTFDSNIFESKQTKLCVMMKEGNLEVALNALKRHLGIKERPDAIDFHTTYKAIPQYQKGHKQKLLNYNFPLMHFIGNYMEGVGVNDCIAKSVFTNSKLFEGHT